MAQKTPVSLMNELAKTNKLIPEYKLVEESGPAHQRTFRLQLTLGDVGTWEGTGSSIKQARHTAARVGLEKCGLCIHEKNLQQQSVKLTPTVELNGLAMKLGKRTEYQDYPPNYSHSPPFQLHVGYPGGQMPGIHRPHGSFPIHQPSSYHNYQHHPNFYQRQGRWPRTFHVSLTVGDQVFKGEGTDKQNARHNAALKAIDALRMELAAVCIESETRDGVDVGVEVNNQQKEQALVQNGNMSQVKPTRPPESGVKSHISLVYEIATKRKMAVQFEDVTNTGPAHMKNFVVRATVGDFIKEGEGPKKKDAKNNTAKQILEELKQLPELPNTDTNKKSGRFVRRGPRIPREKPKVDIDPSLNPISILGQIFQKAKEPSPVYTTVQDRGIIQGTEFIIQVTAGKHQATGTGRNKKAAKKNAAEAMLQLIGFHPTKEEEKPSKEESVSKDLTEAGKSRQVHSILGRQLKPGLLPMVPEMAKMMGCSPDVMMNTVVAPISQVKQETQMESVNVERGLNRAPGAPVVNMPASTSGKSPTSFQKLIHLTEMHGLRMNFTDYPKDNNQSVVTQVSVYCVPQLNIFGSGGSVEGSREEAATKALKELTEMLAKDQLKQGVITSQPSVNMSVVKDEMRERSAEGTSE